MNPQHTSIPAHQHIKLDDHLTLRVPQPEDALAINALILKNQARLAEFMPWANGEPNVSQAVEFVYQHMDDLRLNKPPTFSIWFDEKIIGAIGFHDHNVMDRKVALGYWIDKDFEGRGIISRSCIAMIDHVFEALHLNRVTIFCAEQNIRSRAIPEKLGFTNEGIEIEGQWVHERYLNMVHYRMLESEWRLLRQLAAGNWQ